MNLTADTTIETFTSFSEGSGGYAISNKTSITTTSTIFSTNTSVSSTGVVLVTRSDPVTIDTQEVGTPDYTGNPLVSATVIIVVAIVIFLLLLAAIVTCRSKKQKRQFSPHRMPIIEYKDDNISVSGYSNGGYGTYSDLEDGYLSPDVPSKIEGELKLGFFGTKKEAVYVTT
ncbi:unnamed protein product [Clavelina lepadiformis]|uniref:Uncharacterized protein n=1 Tax=Clavelina lepadiformis TaxID=159417 RepID=A0ABP0F4D6_CLALP